MDDNIIEAVSEEKRKELMNDPDVRNFVMYLCSKIRVALGNITSTTDSLFDSLSVGTINGEEITDALNKIDRSIMSVAKEVIQPEQFYSMLDSEGQTAVLSLADELRSVIGEVKEYFGTSVTVTGECPQNIRFRMDRTMFRAVIAEMTAECCSSGLFPDLLVYAVRRTDDTLAELTVRSINTSGESNTAYDLSLREADVRGINRHVFFDNVQRVLGERYGAAFSRTELPDGILYKMEMEVFPKGSSPIAMTSAGYLSEEDQRFGVVQMSLADFYHTERYHYVDLSRIDDNCDDDEKKSGIKKG